MWQVVFWTFLGFLFGSIPFSVLAGRFFVKTDIRRYGDGNPGGTNAWKAGGWRVGLLAIVLDIAKGYFPVMLAKNNGISEWMLLPVSLAPVLGHMFSPWLKFRGGKALGATGGVWLALIGVKSFIIYALLTLPVLAIQCEHAVAANAGFISLLVYLYFIERSPLLVSIMLLNSLLVAWKHRQELSRPIQLRPWMMGILGRRHA